jgi:hypothetical protein
MQTLISCFDRPSKAREAVDRLVEAGFAREDVHLREAAETRKTVATPEEDAEDRAVGDRAVASPEHEIALDHDALAALSHFFGRLFGRGRHSDQTGTYTEAVRRGNSLVVVDARDDEEAERAATLLHHLGAIDVDEHAQHWRAEGWTGTAAEANAKNLADRPVERPGVRVIDRESEPPLRDIVMMREEEVVVRVPDEPSAERSSIERERAFAAERTTDDLSTTRDPDAVDSGVNGIPRPDRDKPGT